MGGGTLDSHDLFNGEILQSFSFSGLLQFCFLMTCFCASLITEFYWLCPYFLCNCTVTV